MRNIVGIDIGNGDIKCARYGPTGLTEVVRSPRGGKSVPSYIGLTPDGKVLIGEDAREHRLVYPDQVAYGWKMHLGDPGKRYFGGKASAREVLTMALAPILAQCEKQSGMGVDAAVLTWPANFTDAQKQGLLEGCAAARLEVAAGISEPAAAAFASSWKDRAGLNGRVWRVACADLGHGTFDMSILEGKDQNVVPTSTEGIPQLGGGNFTEIIETRLLEKVSKEIGKPLTRDKLLPEQAAELHEKAERAKHALSGQPSTKVALTFGGKSRLIEITQAEYEAAYTPLVQQILTCMDRTMQAVKLTWKDLDRLVLAGGPFLSPRLQEVVANHTSLVPSVEIDPACVVAIGAALHGYNLARQQGGMGVLTDRPILQEATAHDIGVGVIDEASGKRDSVCSVLVPKNTPVPCELKDSFRLERANQTDACIEILQGPNGTPSVKCAKIGVIYLKGLPAEPQRTARIEATCKFDSNTLVTVTAKDLISGTTQTVSVKVSK